MGVVCASLPLELSLLAEKSAHTHIRSALQLGFRRSWLAGSKRVLVVCFLAMLMLFLGVSCCVWFCGVDSRTTNQSRQLVVSAPSDLQ